MKLEKYFDNRLKGDLPYEKMVGQSGAEQSAALYDNYVKLLEDIETAVMVGACESCVYSSEELKIFKTGLSGIRHFLSGCYEENKMKTEQSKPKKKTKPNF